jgi:CHRD domain
MSQFRWEGEVHLAYQNREGFMRFGPTLVVATFALGLVGCMQPQASTVTYRATLTAQAEVPPTNSKGSGYGVFTFDPASKTLSWDVTFQGLTGPAAAGHIHGPAAPGANAGVMVPFAGIPAAPAGEIKGSATLNDAQVAALQGGQMYTNIHTAANKGGEIRGQLQH